ncbi:MAG: hypothetical protein ACE5KA_09460, partial [Nitrososphaerales archaeon]
MSEIEYKRYFVHLPVTTVDQAQLVARESTWHILNYVIEAGPRGVTGDEVAMELEIAPSIAYETLKRLYTL